MDQEKLLRTVARIHAYGRPVDVTKPFITADRYKGVGTGFFIPPPTHADSEDLYLLTCAHVVDSADSVTIMLPLHGLTEHPASVLAFIPSYDLALIAVPGANTTLSQQTEPVTLGSSDKLKLGQKLTAVGYPLGQTAIKVSDGVYAGFQEKLQHTVSISPGNSGGPLMDESGAVVGVNSSGIVSPEASNVGFAVPIEMFALMSNQMFARSRGAPSPERVIHLPIFGFEFAPITKSHSRVVSTATCSSNPHDGGVQIVSVVPGSAMASVVEQGDILVEFDGTPIDTIGEIVVPWNYQKVRLQDMLVRSVQDREYDLRVWKQATRSCAEYKVKPRPGAQNGLRMIYSPYDVVPYTVVVGLVIMPLLANHAMAPATAQTYLRKNTEDLAKPSLIITHVFNGTLAQIEGPVYAGDELSHVNGREVTTLDDVHAAIVQDDTDADTRRVVTFRTCDGKLLVLNHMDALQSEQRAMSEKLYDPEPTFMKFLSLERNTK